MHGHQHRRERQVRVAARIRAAELDPLGLGAGAVHRDAAGRRAVALRVGQVDRRFVARHQPLVAVGRRVGEGQDRRGVLAAGRRSRTAPSRSARRSRCRRTAARRPSTTRCGSACPLPLSPNSGLGMNVTVLPYLLGHVLDDVLVHQQLVGHAAPAPGTAGRSPTGRPWPPRGAGASTSSPHSIIVCIISLRMSISWSAGGTGK